MSKNNQIDLVELPAASFEELVKIKQFFSAAFGWQYKDYGPEYSDTADSGPTHGIIATDQGKPTMPMAVIYAEDLEAAKEKVEQAGGKIIHEIYSFPGGRRFHFADPAGHELAVWSEDNVASK